MSLLDPRNGPAWDLAPVESPRAYVIASTPRTGSTLLCRALWDSGVAGAPAEYLNPMQLRDWEVRLGSPASRWRHLPLRGPLLAAVDGARWPADRRRAHVARVVARRTGPTGWFGLKLHAHHARAWLDDVEAVVGEARWLRIRRADRLGQAISWARALQTGRWVSEQRGVGPVYARTLVDQRIAAIEHDEGWWDARLAGRDVVEIGYEDLVLDWEATVRRALAALGVDAPIPRPSLRRQADAVSEAWRARWLAGG